MLKPIIVTQMTSLLRSITPRDEERVAPWLKAPYSANQWKIMSDLPKPGEDSLELDFDIPAAGGTLSDYPALIRAAKEFAFWKRQLGSKRQITDAVTHVGQVSELLKFLCALTHRGVRSLDALPSSEYRDMLDERSYGSESMLRSAEMVEAALVNFDHHEDLPQSFKVRDGKKWLLARKEILRTLGLPEYIGPVTKVILDQAAIRLKCQPLGPGEGVDLSEITDQHFSKIQSSFHWIYKRRNYLRCENFVFDPALISLSTGKDIAPTPIVPPPLVFKMLAGCAREYEDTAATLKSVASEDRDFAWEERAYRFMMVVRALVLGFTVRRSEELDLMRRNCLRGSDEGGWYVNVFIVKNVKDWVWIPVPPLVADAIRALIALSPELDEDSPLFAICHPRTGKVRTLNNQVKRLNQMAADYGAIDYLADNDVREQWHWTERQFRRFTAVMYFHGYNGSVAAISHILRHFNLGQTWGYTRYDPSLDAMWKEVEKEFLQQIAEEALNGTLGGMMGQKLVRDADKLIKRATQTLEEKIKGEMQDLLIVNPKRMVTAVREVIRRKGLVIIPKAWVICACPASASAARRAACRKQSGTSTVREIGPDFGRAGPQVCPGCIFSVTNEVTREFAKGELEEFKLSCASPCVEGSVLGNLQQTQLITMMRLEQVA